VGDVGVTVFADRDITAVKNTAKQANPNSNRRFDVADGLYLGGMLNGIPSQYIQFLSNKIQITSPTEIDLNAPLVTVTAPEIDLSSWAGITVAWPTNATIPAGWLQCPTAQTLVSLSSYPRLIVLGTSWGGDGVNTVGLPYFAAGYVPYQGTPGVLTHGVVINHIHSGSFVGEGAGYNWVGGSPSFSVATTTGNPTNGGPDNLAAGMGTRFIVKY
ncbi:MAG TPA: phage tail protein, partial [Dehalococcoidia bacterium]|nr:phage tail protein [Dehalococcoidia bacterium]